MKNRKNDKIIFAEMQEMGDLKVRQALPSFQQEYFDPFILLHHAHIFLPEDMELAHAGVGPHPHRGFSPVTFVFKGGSHHRDSRGNNNKIFAGGTQWMNAGMGIMHSERPLEQELEIIQMWINSPAKNKMDQPSYFPLKKEDTPVFKSDDEKCEVRVISGEILGIKGPIPTLTPINSAMIFCKKGGNISIPISSSHHVFIYLLDGEITLSEGTHVSGFNMVLFGNEGEGISLEAMKDTRALLMSGLPIGEEIFAQGPFVMNNEIQIMEAYRDYRMGKMGILIEE